MKYVPSSIEGSLLVFAISQSHCASKYDHTAKGGSNIEIFVTIYLAACWIASTAPTRLTVRYLTSLLCYLACTTTSSITTTLSSSSSSITTINMSVFLFFLTRHPDEQFDANCDDASDTVTCRHQITVEVIVVVVAVSGTSTSSD
jgi:hypothetical protein